MAPENRQIFGFSFERMGYFYEAEEPETQSWNLGHPFIADTVPCFLKFKCGHQRREKKTRAIYTVWGGETLLYGGIFGYQSTPQSLCDRWTYGRTSGDDYVWHYPLMERLLSWMWMNPTTKLWLYLCIDPQMVIGRETRGIGPWLEGVLIETEFPLLNRKSQNVADAMIEKEFIDSLPEESRQKVNAVMDQLNKKKMIPPKPKRTVTQGAMGGGSDE